MCSIDLFDDESMEDMALSDEEFSSFESMINGGQAHNEEGDWEDVVEDEIDDTLDKPKANNVLSIDGLPDLTNADPLVLADIIFNIMNVVEEKLINNMEVNQSPQIRPMDIFLSKNPYSDFEFVVSKSDALKALNQIEILRTEVRDQISKI